MAVTFKVDFDLAPFRREVDNFVRKQIPFARALAVTLVAAKAKDTLKREAPKHFRLRRKWLVQGIRSTRASKANPTALVGSIDDFMVLQTKGGFKRPGAAGDGGRQSKGPRGSGRTVAVPIRARKGRMSVTRPRSWPGKLIRRLGDKGRIFVQPGRGGSVLVFQILGSLKRPKLKLMWSLQRQVKVRKRWPLEQTVEQVMRDQWDKMAVKALEQALKTGR